MKWFGKPYGAPYEAECEHVETPVGVKCMHCGERILAGEDGLLIPHVGVDGKAVESPWHYECHMRGIVGGFNHQRGRCTCCGGTEPPDPRGMKPRQAAMLAVAYHETSMLLGLLRQRQKP